MANWRQNLGREGEDLAEDYLHKHGYVILVRNARTPYGEIDIIARQGPVTVFVEVKTRRSTKYGWPEEAVQTQKQARLIASAEAYLQANPDLEGDWRIDVIAIQLERGRPPLITHFDHAIS
jgi:putative endonuclease